MSSTTITENGPTPLWRVFLDHRQGVSDKMSEARKLLECGYDPNERWEHNIWLESLYTGGCVLAPLDLSPLKRESPLISAILNDNIELAMLLLRHGASTEVCINSCWTPLHAAVYLNRKRMVTLLLEHGAKLGAVTGDQDVQVPGQTALHMTAEKADLEMISLLLDAGANVHATSKFGWTAIDIVILDGQSAIIHLLIQRNPSIIDALRDLSILALPTSWDLDSEQRAAVARHLLKNNIANTSNEHNRFYKHCLRTVLNSGKVDMDNHSKFGKIAAMEVEQFLMANANLCDPLVWDRNLCSQCYQFQNQEYQTTYDVFQHSNSYASLLQSAKHGCCLCQVLVRALQEGRDVTSNSSDAKQLVGETSEVFLQLNPYTMLVACGKKSNYVSLGHVSGTYQP